MKAAGPSLATEFLHLGKSLSPSMEKTTLLGCSLPHPSFFLNLVKVVSSGLLPLYHETKNTLNKIGGKGKERARKAKQEMTFTATS